MAKADSPRVRGIDSTAIPVIITLRRDSLGLEAGASPQRVTNAIEAALPELRRAADFEVLAISPAILAINVHARPPVRQPDLVSALRRHRLVANVEMSGIVRVP